MSQNSNRKTMRAEGAITSIQAAREDVQPDTIPSSSVPSSMGDPAPTTRSSKPVQSPVAFVEKDFLNPTTEQGYQQGTASLPQSITSGDTTCTCTAAPAKKQLTNHGEDKTDKTNNNRVMIKSEDSLADTDTSNNEKRREQGSEMPIKSEEVDNIDGAFSTICNRTRRGKRKQYRAEEDSINSNDSHNANKTKNRRVGGHAGGEGRTATDHSTPKRTRLKSKQVQEEDNAADETKCCKLCNDSDWENKIYFKCGTVLSKYFPKSQNNPNPGWYKGTIQMHHVSSSIFGSDSEYEYEEEADISSEEKSEQQQIIFNEIHYDDGDTENITQDDLKLQVMGGRKVKILQSAKIATVSNSECCNPGNVVLTTTLSSNKFDRNWLQKYHKLQEFENENGHCQVPYRYGPDPSLGLWVRKQRKRYKEGNMSEDRKRKLNKIGFDWDPRAKTPDQAWQEKFVRLKEFKAENGHCRVPRHHGPDPYLGNWVNNQRASYSKGTIPPDREEKLNKLGFEWVLVAQTPDQMWQEKYDGLKMYKEENGHCRVPRNYGPDPSLANWVINQRKNYKQRKVAEDRFIKLEKIGFEWDPRNLLKYSR